MVLAIRYGNGVRSYIAFADAKTQTIKLL